MNNLVSRLEAEPSFAAGAVIRVVLYQPELATLVNQPPEGGAWLHEIKLDGYRTAARIDGGK